MNRPPDDFEAELAARFGREVRSVPEQPFIGIMRRRIAAARRRRRYLNYALQATALAALVLGSHPLIDASAIVSAKLDVWFALGVDWLVRPVGTLSVIIAVLCVAVTAFYRRLH